MIFTLLSIFVFVSYAVLIAAITIGWWRLKSFKHTGSLPEVKVSVIVAVRNEATKIKVLLESLLSQDYPPHLFEIIIVDDNSEDQTVRLVEEAIAKQRTSPNLNLISLLTSADTGKKAAINHGIQSSKAELIVITDADCTAASRWISTVAAFYTLYKPQMILGPVRMTDKGGLWGKLQSLEFMSLIASAAGSSSAGFPLLANGANIAFTRHAYENCGAYAGNMQYPSGDDMFMMMSIKKKFGAGAIRFIHSEDAIVNTPAIKGLSAFIQQRIRWVSKSRGYTDPFLVAASIVVFLTNVLLIATACGMIINPGFIKLFLILYFFKLLVDFPLIRSYSRFQRSRYLVWLFPLMELVNGVYTFIIGIAGNIGRYEWKGRKISPYFHK